MSDAEEENQIKESEPVIPTEENESSLIEKQISPPLSSPLPKLCSGPDLRLRPSDSEPSVLTTFVHDVENALYFPDIQGLYKLSHDSVSSKHRTAVSTDGSQTNIGYIDTESEGSTSSCGWTWQQAEPQQDVPVVLRRQSRSFIDRTKRFVRRSRERLSLIDLDGRALSIGGTGPQHPRFIRLAEKPISSPTIEISKTRRLPSDILKGHSRNNFPERMRRPLSSIQTRQEQLNFLSDNLAQSAYQGDQGFYTSSSTSSATEANTSLRNRESHDDDIDWSWVDEAMTRYKEEEHLAGKNNLQPSTTNIVRRADAECQTPSDPSWDEERTRVSTAREELSPVDDGAAGACASAGNEMLGKTEDESGPSGLPRREPGPSVSSWLRQSMRRVTHFNLGDPPSERPASAPAVVTQPEPPPAPPPGADSPDSLGYISDSTDRQTSPGQRIRSDNEESCDGRSPLGPWPHRLSSVLALLGCTLGLFNISRFSVLSVHFGVNFILQFICLSIVLGIPILAFHCSVGQTLGAGPIDMWKISPIFQGIGIAMLLSQALVGIYSVVGVSWIFIYFRDSFITKQDTYRWAEPFRLYREDAGEIPGQFINQTLGRLDITVPDYLNGVVLQRHGLASQYSSFSHLKFQLTFNLAVMWMIVFVCLSKGLRSYGKVVYLFSLVPVLGTFVLASKLLGLTPTRHGLFPHTDWSDFFFNARSWVSAITEVMLTWNFLGAAAMQVASHNKPTKKLWRDVAVVALITLFVLILSAFLANTCHQILSMNYSYLPSSFESISTCTFLRPMGAPLPPHYATPLRSMPHISLVAGDRVLRPGGVQESGYQVIRLATELMPATLALIGSDLLSPFWAVLFYFTLILFGIAQQLAIWHCVITGVMAINAKALKSWETTITFFACATGFVLGLPMTTELGVFVVYFLDYCVGGGWWILVVTLTELCAVLMVRGRPYTGEHFSIALFGETANNCFSYWATPLLAFTWSVIMPVALFVTCITVFKSGGYRDIWDWRSLGRAYWSLWVREIGVLLQLLPLLCIPLVALIQSYRYLSNGSPDILDRLTSLYRPNFGRGGSGNTTNVAPSSTNETAGGNANDTPRPEDPPPKYTPPPSYSTATGVRIAKLLRQSFRRSVRRIQAVLEPEPVAARPPPPDYHSVLVEMTHDEPATHTFTAEDVANVLRCSFRRSGPSSVQSSATTPSTLTNLMDRHRHEPQSAPSSLTSPSTTTSSLCSPTIF